MTAEKARAQRVYKSQQRGLEEHQDTQPNSFRTAPTTNAFCT